jgi:hypothetical protein
VEGVDSKRVLLIFSWPSPWAIRVLLSEWKFRRRFGWNCSVLDFSSAMNAFGKQHGLVVASPFFFIKKHLLIFQALRFWCFLFYLDMLRTSVQNRRDLVRGHVSVDHEYCDARVELYHRGALNSMKSLYPSYADGKVMTGQSELKSLERMILTRSGQSILKISNWVMFSGRFPIDLLFWRISACFGAIPLFVETGRGPSTRVISHNLFTESGYRELVESNWKHRPDDWKTIVNEYLDLRRKSSTPSQVFWNQGKYASVSIKTNKKICSFFLSTNEEFLPHIVDSEYLPFEKQSSALSWVVERCREHDLFLVIRDHPGKGKEDNIDVSLLQEIQVTLQENVLFISKSDQASSIAIIEASDFCITFGSSVGVDVVLQRKPLLCLGPNVLVSQEMARMQRGRYQHFFSSPGSFIHSLNEIEKFVLFESSGGLPLDLNEDWFH